MDADELVRLLYLAVGALLAELGHWSANWWRARVEQARYQRRATLTVKGTGFSDMTPEKATKAAEEIGDHLKRWPVVNGGQQQPPIPPSPPRAKTNNPQPPPGKRKTQPPKDAA